MAKNNVDDALRAYKLGQRLDPTDGMLTYADLRWRMSIITPAYAYNCVLILVLLYVFPHTSSPHTSVYVSIRQHTPAYVSVCHMLAYASIHQHTPAYAYNYVLIPVLLYVFPHASSTGICVFSY